MGKEEPKRPLSLEGQKALEEAQSFLEGTKKYDHRLGDYKAPMGDLATGTRREVARPSDTVYASTRMKSVRTSRKVSPRLLSDAASHAKSIESRIPDLFEE